MSDSSTSIARAALVGYKLGFDCSKRTVVSVRDSDNFEFDRRAMTRDEFNKHCKENPMRVNNKTETEIDDPMLGEKRNSLTVTAVGGRDSGGNRLASVKCDCGVEQDGVILGQVRCGTKKFCNGMTCPIARRLREKNRATRPVAAVKANGRRRAAKAAPPPSAPWIGALSSEATLLRKTAVAILAGKADPIELARLMRDQADFLDELVYGDA